MKNQNSTKKQVKKRRPSLAKSKQLLLSPRGYISWSQLNLFESSESRYIRKYFYGEDIEYRNDFMDFGKRFATAKETGDPQGDMMLDFAIKAVPTFEKDEYEFIVNFETEYGVIPILCKLDSFSIKLIQNIEYKTGKTVWTQARVNKSGQLLFYSTGILSKFGVNPKQKLVWLPTTIRNGSVVPTGEILQFDFLATGSQLLEMKKRIVEMALRVDKLYKEHLKIC